jgi:Uma2 family endonuclease
MFVAAGRGRQWRYTDGMTTKTRVTLDEFLSMPEEGPPWLELIDGQVLEKPMPTLPHGRLALRAGRHLDVYLEETGEGTVYVEARHNDRENDRSYLPDVSVVLRGRLNTALGNVRYAEIPPDLAIEVVSPDDRAKRIIERVNYYLARGTSLVWIIEPQTETLTAYRPDGTYSIHRAPDVIDAKPVLRAFKLDLAKLFAILHEEV